MDARIAAAVAQAKATILNHVPNLSDEDLRKYVMKALKPKKQKVTKDVTPDMVKIVTANPKMTYAAWKKSMQNAWEQVHGPRAQTAYNKYKTERYPVLKAEDTTRDFTTIMSMIAAEWRAMKKPVESSSTSDEQTIIADEEEVTTSVETHRLTPCKRKAKPATVGSITHEIDNAPAPREKRTRRAAAKK